MNIEKFSIELIKGKAVEVLEFPVKPTESAKAILVVFESGNAWIFTSLFGGFFREYRRKVSLDSLPVFLREIRENMRDELIPLKKAGKGPTEKSHKFKVDVLREKGSEYRAEVAEYEPITKTVTLGLFAITEINGEFFTSYKMIEKKLEKGCVLPRGVRAYNALKLILEAAAERVRKESEVLDAEYMRGRAEAAAAASKKREAEKAIKAEQEAQKIKDLLPMVSKEGDHAIRVCKERFSLDEMKRKLKNILFSWNKLPEVPLLPETLSLEQLEVLCSIIKISRGKIKMPDKIIEGATVKWVDWIGPAANRRRQESESDMCIVKFFGEKRVIIFSDGDQIVKMHGPNLEILGGIEVQQQ